MQRSISSVELAKHAANVEVDIAQVPTLTVTPSVDSVDQPLGEQNTHEASSQSLVAMLPSGASTDAKERIEHLAQVLGTLRVHEHNIEAELGALLREHQFYAAPAPGHASSLLQVDENKSVTESLSALGLTLRAQLWPKNTVPLLDNTEPSATAKDSLSRFGISYNGFGFTAKGLSHEWEQALLETLPGDRHFAGYMPEMIPYKQLKRPPVWQNRPYQTSDGWNGLLHRLTKDTKVHIINKLLHATQGYSHNPDVLSSKEGKRVKKQLGPKLDDTAYRFVTAHLQYGVIALCHFGLNPACADFISCLQFFIAELRTNIYDPENIVTQVFLREMHTIGTRAKKSDVDKHNYLGTAEEVWMNAAARETAFWGKEDLSGWMVKHCRYFNNDHPEYRFLGTGFYFTPERFRHTAPSLPLPEPAPMQNGDDSLLRLTNAPELFAMFCSHLDLKSKIALSQSQKKLVPYIQEHAFTPGQKATTTYQHFIMRSNHMQQSNSIFCWRCGNWTKIPKTAVERREHAHKYGGTEADPNLVGPRLDGQNKNGMMWNGTYFVNRVTGKRSRHMSCVTCVGKAIEKFGARTDTWWE